ncbi:MAG: BamA/TamA family outer membrane protein [Bacteroidia bacterium]|nr:sorting and assembly machinery component 50 [Bacteroidia bacterium]MDW8159248.1 BamA/TamA family outer membrane protein [Bacteroidia bacterium]
MCANILLVVIALFYSSCEPTLTLSKGERLVEKPPTFRFKQANTLQSQELSNYVKTQANRRVLISKLYLHLYNLGHFIEKDSSILKKLYCKLDKRGYYLNPVIHFLKEVIGEYPAKLDLRQVVEDCKNLENYYLANGYFDAKVCYEIKPLPIDPMRVSLIFHILEGKPNKIYKIEYNTGQAEVDSLLQSAQKESYIKLGQNYNENALIEERSRLARVLRNAGYYNAHSGAFEYYVRRPDTLVGVDTLNSKWLVVQIQSKEHFEKYRNRDIHIQLRRFPEDTILLSFETPSTQSIGSLRLRSHRTLPTYWQASTHALKVMHPKTIQNVISIIPDSFFNLENVLQSQRRLQQLAIFQNAIVIPTPDTQNKVIDYYFDLVLQNRYSFRLGFEAFQSEDVRFNTNLPGFGLNFQLAKRNAFRRAERIHFELGGSVSIYDPNRRESIERKPIQFFWQGGARVNYTLPRLLFLESFSEKQINKKWLNIYAPSTNLILAYNYERPLEFQRKSFNINFQYQWSHNSENSLISIFTPLALTLVESQLSPTFEDSLRVPLVSGGDFNTRQLAAFIIRRDFQPRFNSSTRYQRIYSYNYGVSRTQNTWYLRTSAEMGGNIPFLVDWLLYKLKREPSFTDNIIDTGRVAISYAQFYRASVEFKYFIPFRQNAELVLRSFVGIGGTFRDSASIPFEYRFFSGGINSVRGWQSNTLGPGTFPTGLITQAFAFGGEYKFEFNLEFRHNFINPLKLAWFLDAGNVWWSKRTKPHDGRELLALSNLRLGVAAGIGFRFDFSFLVIRLDIGQQIYAPDGRGFVLEKIKDLAGQNIQYNLGIGYPF